MFRPLLSAALCIAPAWAQAHEFWISPDDYVVEADGIVTAALRNGEDFAGSSLSYIPNRAARFDMVVDGATAPVPARLGDNPAFSVEGLPEGLMVIVHETTDSTITYRPKGGRTGWERFVAFTEHKAMDGAPEDHVARGLPQEGVTERYRRFAKALVAVGGGAGADAPVGLRTEIVAEANPYTDDLSDGLPVTVLFEGEPRANAQVELFERAADGTVAVTTHVTDDAGRAALPVRAGHEYLADAVTLLPLDPETNEGAQWQTLWAALTFAVPEA